MTSDNRRASEHLLPRVFGFELLMAPYAVAHMKLGLQLAQTGYGILAFISNHGNAKKREVAPDGSKDENVFDIQQGVAICIMVKNARGKPKGERR